MENKREDYLTALEAVGAYGHGDEEALQALLKVYLPRPFTTPVIHLAGTNGKGSTGAMIASILEEAGLSTGHFSSPHLVSYRERIRLRQKEIPHERLQHAFEKLKPLVEEDRFRGKLSYFQISLVLALYAFQEANLDIVLVEAGIGARYDSTRILHSVVLSVITTLGYDHRRELGDSLASIAYHKAGVIRPNVAAVAMDYGPYGEIFQREADRCHAPLRLMEKPTYLGGELKTQFSLGGRFFEIPFPPGYPMENAALAVTAVKTLYPDLEEDVIRRGLAKVQWPGRLEIIRENPLILLDGAHNPQGLEALQETVRRLRRGKLFLILGMMKRKTPGKELKALVDLAEKVYWTSFDDPGAMERKDYLALGASKDRIFSSPGEALAKAEELADANDLILVTGSLYVVGECKKGRSSE